MACGTQTQANFNILYTVYVGPHMEHCIQVSGPYLKQDIKTLEKVQWKATKMVQGLKKMT